MNNKKPIIKKVANNMLEFLIDPTLFPPERHIYFHPEEILDNKFYEDAKKDSERAYGDQRQNSDFYQNRPIREASLMERKTLIASLDVLSQNFNESDPIAKDLRTMAYAISKMSEKELRNRLASDVKAKVNTEVEMNKTDDKKEAGKIKGPGIPDGTGPMKDDPSCPKNKDDKEAAVKDFWNKEATEAVRKGLIAEVTEICDSKKEKEIKAEETVPEKKEATTPEEKESCDDKKKEEKKEVEAPTTEVKESCDDKKKEEKKEVEAKGKKEEETSDKVTEENEVTEEVDSVEKKANSEQPSKDEKEATEVDTSLLTATSVFDGIEMNAGLTTVEDIGDLSEAEKKRLDLLFK